MKIRLDEFPDEASMTALRTGDSRNMTGYRQAHLASAFDRICDGRDWKAPTHTLIPTPECLVVEQAPVWSVDQLIVSADGYHPGAERTRA
ncbi:MAG: hypothetical protein ABJD11_00850 [Gemmatimonadota bacterium]